MAATIKRLTVDAQGFTTITGTGACTIKRLKVNTAVKYNVSVESRAMYVGPKKGSYGEVFYLELYCNFQDTHDFLVSLKSDKKRFRASEDYHTDESVENNQAAAGQVQFRQSIVCTPEEGFYGQFFQYKFEKALARNGAFEFTGADINYMPRPSLGPEFISAMEDIDNGW